MTQFCLWVVVEDFAFEPEVSHAILNMGYGVQALSNDGKVCASSTTPNKAVYILAYLISPPLKDKLAQDFVKEFDAKFTKSKIKHLGFVLGEFKSTNISWMQSNYQANYGIQISLGKQDKEEKPVPKDPNA